MEPSKSPLSGVLRNKKDHQKAVRTQLEIEINCKVKQHLQLIELVAQIRRLKMVKKYQFVIEYTEKRLQKLRDFVNFVEK